jgi:hypothetical protein
MPLMHISKIITYLQFFILNMYKHGIEEQSLFIPTLWVMQIVKHHLLKLSMNLWDNEL